VHFCDGWYLICWSMYNKNWLHADHMLGSGSSYDQQHLYYGHLLCMLLGCIVADKMARYMVSRNIIINMYVLLLPDLCIVVMDAIWFAEACTIKTDCMLITCWVVDGLMISSMYIMVTCSVFCWDEWWLIISWLDTW
jgi:hypothetical protein